MTRADWFLLANPTDLYGELTMVRADRPLYLLVCAYLRRVWDILPNKWICAAVEATEAFIDGRASIAATMQQWALAEVESFSGVWCAISDYDDHYNCPCCNPQGLDMADFALRQYFLPAAAWLIDDPAWLPARAAFFALKSIRNAHPGDERHPQVSEERDVQREMFRCLCRGPSGYDRLASWHPNDPDARGLLRAVAREEQPEKAMMLALADALEEENGDGAILDHLRDGGPHFRGCWAVEVLNGRAGRVPRVDRRTVETYRRSWW